MLVVQGGRLWVGWKKQRSSCWRRARVLDARQRAWAGGVAAVEPAIVRDVVVVVPGIMGSELVARDGRPLWPVSAGSLAASIRALRRGELVLPNRIGDEAAGDGVEPTRLLDTLHVIPGLWSPVTGYDGLWQFLRGPRFRLIEERLQNASVIPNLIASQTTSIFGS